jgi:hypothetical protein
VRSHDARPDHINRVNINRGITGIKVLSGKAQDFISVVKFRRELNLITSVFGPFLGLMFNPAIGNSS